MAVGKTNGIPFWLVGDFAHFRIYFSGKKGMLTGGTGFWPMAKWLRMEHPIAAPVCYVFRG